MLAYSHVQRQLLSNWNKKSTLLVNCCRTAFKRTDTPGPDAEIFENTQLRKAGMEKESFEGEFDPDFPPKGRIYDKKPFRMELLAGKKYSWCACGFSKNQPLCDGTHKKIASTEYFPRGVTGPVRFTVEESKPYFLCNCKQTKNRPFCDGTHRRDDIQSTRVSV